jgi:hypothetical protein
VRWVLRQETTEVEDSVLGKCGKGRLICLDSSSEVWKSPAQFQMALSDALISALISASIRGDLVKEK